MLRWQDSFAFTKASEKELVLAVPETGIRRIKPVDFTWGAGRLALLLQPTKTIPQAAVWLGVGSFPSLHRYRRALIC